MLAHVDRLARREMQRHDLPGAIAAEGDVSRTMRLGEEDGQSREEPLHRAAHRPHADVHLGVLPQQHVVLEVDRH